MNKSKLVFVVLFCIGLFWIWLLGKAIAATAPLVSIEAYPKPEFNPSKAEIFTIPVKINQPGNIKLEIYTPDGGLVRTLSSDKHTKAGVYQIPWDGKDETKTIVPDEAYIPVVTLIAAKDKKATSYDPRTFSGGEELVLSPQIYKHKQLVFQLDSPARVLARAGIKSGPMMNTLLNWQVRGQGSNILAWNGYDQDGLVDLYQNDQLTLLLTGFKLPQHAVITTGNEHQTYLEWHAANYQSAGLPDLTQARFERNGQRISRHYYLPRAVDIAPRVTLDILGELPKNQEGLPIVSGPASLRVGILPEDRWAMQQSLYEVAFFIDYQFLSEQEQGYVPLTWRWDPTNLAPGVHLVTVNVSGFNGQVGVSSLFVEVAS